MNKQCKEYINEVQSMFPVKGKQERKYIKNLKKDIEEYCNETNATKKEELYENYGHPIDVVAEYFSATGISYVIKKVRFNRYIKALIAVIIAVTLIISSMYCVFRYEQYQAKLKEDIVFASEGF